MSQDFSDSNGPESLFEATIFVVSKQHCMNLEGREEEPVFFLLPGTVSRIGELS